MLINMKSIVVIVGLSLMALFGTPAFANRTEKIDLIIPALQVDQVIAERIAELVSAESGLQINLVALPDESMSTLDALEAGFGDIAFVPNTGVYREGVSTVIPLYPSVLHIVADQDRPSGNLEELFRDAVVYAGQQDSMPRQLVNRIIDGLELAHQLADQRVGGTR